MSSREPTSQATATRQTNTWASIDTALAHAPGMKVQSVAMPGSPFAGGHHYGVYLRGNQPLTSRLLKPVLINADDGTFGETRDMPL